MLTLEQKTKLKNAGYSDTKINVFEARKAIKETEAQKEPGYIERLKTSFQGRQEEVKKINLSDTSLPEKILQNVGQVAGGAFDIVAEAPVIKQGLDIAGQGIKKLSETAPIKEIGEAIAPATEKALKTWESLPENIRKDLEAVVNIASIIPVSAGAKGSLIAGEKALATGGKVVKAGKKIIEPISTKIKTGLSTLKPKDYETAVTSINNAYKTGFVNDQVAVNKQLTKLGSVVGKSSDELVSNLAKEGIVPQVEGKLAKFDNSLTELTNRQNQISQEIRKNLRPINAPTSLGELRTSLIDDVTRTSDPAELTKSLAEVDRTIESYRLKYGDIITTEQLDEIRVSANNATKSFDRPIFEQDVSNSIGNVVRKRIDDIVPDEAVRSANAEWGRLADIKNTIQIFDNKPINVGILGSQLGRFGGAIALGGLASPLSGPGALVIAGIAATYGGDFVANFLRSRKFSKVAQDLIKQSLQKQPDILKTLIEKSSEANKVYLQKLLPAPKTGTPQIEIKSGSQINLPKESPSAVEQRTIKTIQSQLEKSSPLPPTIPKSTSKVNLNNQRNASGIKDSANKYRQGGKFKQWSDFYEKNGQSYDINSKEQVKEALAFHKKENPSMNFKAVKMKDGSYSIFAENK